MILIVGGAYQGKLDYVLNRFELTKDNVSFCTDEDTTYPLGNEIICQVDKWILSLLRADKNITSEINQFIKDNQDTIVICDDISCGVVPVDPLIRKWREEVSKFLGVLAINSDEVIRLYCGIPARLK